VTGILQDEAIWPGIPESLRDKLAAAKMGWDGLEITEDSLNEIPDDTWVLIEAKLKEIGLG